MAIATPLDLAALVLAAIHFGTPLAYYTYLKRKWLPKPWSIKADPSYLPKISIIIPTYNEARFIVRKLEDVYSQDYPRDMMEVIVIDSASTDGTPELVREWSSRHLDARLKLVAEPVRRGKAWALNNALKHVSSDAEIVIVTDVDSWWIGRDTLRRVASIFADPIVGAVTCLKKPQGDGVAGIESGYREFYNVVRLGESKWWSTPVFHGELAAFRKKLLEEVGGFPTDIGSDDSHTATLIALKGYRSIATDSAWCIESVPTKHYFAWRIRRAQHLVQHFIKTLRTKHKTRRELKTILRIETFLHLANPWLLLAATTILAISTIATGSLAALAILAIGIAALSIKHYRTWIATQLILIAATIRNLWTKELAWTKDEKHIETKHS